MPLGCVDVSDKGSKHKKWLLKHWLIDYSILESSRGISALKHVTQQASYLTSGISTFTKIFSADNRILAVADAFFKKGEKVIFVSKDINARLKADALGIGVQDFEKQKINFDELFCGYREMQVPGSVVQGVQGSNLKKIAKRSTLNQINL